MKNIKPLILLMLFGMLSFAQTASGQLQADDTRDSKRLAISPYAQAVPNDSYTFMGISHPSLDTALTQIGVVVEVIGMVTTTNNAAGRASVFTVDAGETHRGFVVNQSHASINSSKAAFTDARTHLINTPDTAQFGSVRITTQQNTATTAVTVGSTKKYANLSQLNIWGVVYVEAAGTGFAMEFIGDMQDSTVGGNLTNGARGINYTGDGSTPVGQSAGRGIN
jgi:hypothetical protein